LRDPHAPDVGGGGLLCQTESGPAAGIRERPFSVAGPGDDMERWQYKVIYVDFRGRISSEGAEYIRQSGEHRTGFVRSYLDKLGEDGWEVTGVLPLLRPESSYFMLKRPAQAESSAQG
jgi:hypothetical protein